MEKLFPRHVHTFYLHNKGFKIWGFFFFKGFKKALTLLFARLARREAAALMDVRYVYRRACSMAHAHMQAVQHVLATFIDAQGYPKR